MGACQALQVSLLTSLIPLRVLLDNLVPVNAHSRADRYEGDRDDTPDNRPDDICTGPVFLRALGARRKRPYEQKDDVDDGNAHEEQREHPLTS